MTTAAVIDFAEISRPADQPVIVGKAADFLEALKKNFPKIKVIEQKDLDLNRAELTRAK